MINRSAIKQLIETLRGSLFQPGDESYDKDRTVWNGRIDRHPAAIACCKGTADVMIAANFAHEQIEKGNEYGMLPYSLAAAHAVRGETDEALRWLERAVELGWPYELTTIHDPLLASLRDEERFEALVDRMHERNEEMRRRLAQAEEQERADRLPPAER